MTKRGQAAAVLLAAGASSRMGRPKALLPVGHSTALERVVTALSQAGIKEVVLVTRSENPDVAALASKLALRQVENPRPDKGMLFSAALGAQALSETVEAFFVWPLDCALVHSWVLDKLLAAFFALSPRPAVVRPCCLGRHGHPPLLAGELRTPLATLIQENEFAAGYNLPDFRAFLAHYAGLTIDVETEDASILMDMDTPEDHARLQRFACWIDETTPSGQSISSLSTPSPSSTRPSSASPSSASLSEEDCLYLHMLLRTPKEITRHCQTVARVGTALGHSLVAHGIRLDQALIKSACLLHDLAKHKPQHAQAAANVLRNLGLNALAQIVESHMVLHELAQATPPSIEAEVVFLADMLVVGDRVVTLNEKVEQARVIHSAFPNAVDRMTKRVAWAKAIAERLAPWIGDLERPETLASLVDLAQVIDPHS
ncbi:MAG: NTP transferase domain-containing protein [Thermoleophilia bacterium]|nr:NTP transferase domain-containing protein [Thermoleophilia bacterium]